MRILFDTNVIMDFIVKRKPFSDDAEKAIDICMRDNFQGCIASHTIPNLHYILRKHLTKEQRKDILLEMCSMFTVIGIDAVKLVSALENDDFSDFEDCLQFECAKDFEVDYIITRNLSDFKSSTIPVLEPSNFISKIEAIDDTSSDTKTAQ